MEENENDALFPKLEKVDTIQMKEWHSFKIN